METFSRYTEISLLCLGFRLVPKNRLEALVSVDSM